MGGEFNQQLSDLTARLCGMVAERVASATRHLDRNTRRQIDDMLENDLPTVVTNTIAKTASLHSAEGVQYMEAHLDDWADDWAKKLIGRD